MPVETRTDLKVLGTSAPGIDPSAGTENAVLTNLRDGNRALDNLRRALEIDERRGEERLYTDRLV
ncbi:hypothetical protein [Aureimonas mangrovi]|uniref:hypothetical protein n=1 Tax=Aureimonas mangrovi TaxID=2758041 RepID=UPI00163D4DD1|nr:hypothetical protein [Aureimonas mangrovi]